MAIVDINKLASWVREARLTLVELNPEEDPVPFKQYRILCELPDCKPFFMNDCKTGHWIYENLREAESDFDRIIEWQQRKLN